MIRLNLYIGPEWLLVTALSVSLLLSVCSKQGNLQQALAHFNTLRESPGQIQARLGDITVADHYSVIRSHVADKSWTAAQARNYLNGAAARDFTAQKIQGGQFA